VYQTAARLYGGTDNHGDPASAEAYSGAWVRDVQSAALTATEANAANNTPGVILIRRPPLPGRAAGVGLGVRRDKVQGRLWHFYALVPGISYAATSAKVKREPLPFLLTQTQPRASGPIVTRIQRALSRKGINPGKFDGVYGPLTVAAVAGLKWPVAGR
jgi:N-acetylmuramoyl-L-alanine amidase